MKYIIAIIVCIILTLLVRFIYIISSDNFYFDFIGGGIVMIIFNSIIDWKKWK
jgi:hypothetical protein